VARPNSRELAMAIALPSSLSFDIVSG